MYQSAPDLPTACTICHRTLDQHDQGRTSCRYCTAQLAGWLREIPLQLVLLHDMLAPGANPSQGTTTGTAVIGRSPVRDDVLNWLGQAVTTTATRDPYGDQSGHPSIASVLYGWADRIAQDHGCIAPALRPGQTWPGWLTSYLSWAVRQDWIAEMHREIGELLGRVRGTTRTAPQRQLMDAPCRCGAFALTTEDLQPQDRLKRLGRPLYIACEACGQLYTQQEYEDHRAQVMPRLLRTAILIAARAAQDVEDGEVRTDAA